MSDQCAHLDHVATFFLGHASATSNVTQKEIIKRLHIIESEWIWSVSYQKHGKSPFFAAMISSIGISFCKMSRILTFAPESWKWEMPATKDYFPLQGQVCQLSFILYFHDDLRIWRRLPVVFAMPSGYSQAAFASVATALPAGSSQEAADTRRPGWDVFKQALVAFWWQFVHRYTTSSTAQGGGGSFKKRKTIGQIGCCESRMSKQKHWPID